MVSVFLWSSQVEEKLRQVRLHAEKPQNWYRHFPGAPVPGDQPAFVLRAGTVRAVFTWTVAPFGVLRHLTVSVPGGGYPMPMIVWTLAYHFGFTGVQLNEHRYVPEPGPWQFTQDAEERCIVVQELVQPDPVDTAFS